jgi:hypothetical protein
LDESYKIVVEGCPSLVIATNWEPLSVSWWKEELRCISVGQLSSVGVWESITVFFPGTLGNVWRQFDCHTRVEGVLLGSWVEARDPTRHLTTHRKMPSTRNYPARNVSASEAEKPCPKASIVYDD